MKITLELTEAQAEVLFNHIEAEVRYSHENDLDNEAEAWENVAEQFGKQVIEHPK